MPCLPLNKVEEAVINYWKLIPNLWHAESGQESQMVSLQSVPSGEYPQAD